MFREAIKWMRREWWGVIVAHFIVLLGTYLLIWQLAEPIGIPDSLEELPNFAKKRFFFHLSLTLIIGAYLTLILATVLRHKDLSNKKSSTPKLLPLETIGFGHADTSMEKCWKISENPDQTQPNIRCRDDGFKGRVLKITSTCSYAADYRINSNARLGQIVAFAIKPDHNCVIYVRVGISSRDGTATKNVWLNLKLGVGKSLPHGDGNAEWVFPINPIPAEGGWLHCRVDLEDAVAQTFGTSGWLFDHLRAIRLRGNLSLSYISVFAREA